MESNQPICYCKNVSYSEVNAAYNSGAVSVADIMEETGVGKHCGCCIHKVEVLLEEKKNEK